MTKEVITLEVLISHHKVKGRITHQFFTQWLDTKNRVMRVFSKNHARHTRSNKQPFIIKPTYVSNRVALLFQQQHEGAPFCCFCAEMALTVKILWTFMTLRTARNYLHTGLVLELLKPRETKYKPIRGNDTYGLILCLTRCKAQKFTRVIVRVCIRLPATAPEQAAPKTRKSQVTYIPPTWRTRQ